MGKMWLKTKEMNLITDFLSGKTPKDTASVNSKRGLRTANDKRLNLCLSTDFRSLATIHKLILQNEIIFIFLLLPH